MSEANDRLYNLLPAIYRQRDAASGEPLRALLTILADEVDVIEDDIARLYDNWFIETCDDWVVPYLGDLVGYNSLSAGEHGGDSAAFGGVVLSNILSPRRDVANTIRYRRRKGTLALLERLVGDVAAWPARAVEFAELTATTQSLDHFRADRGRTADLRNTKAMTALGTALDRTARTIGIRQSKLSLAVGPYNLRTLGLFVWRLKSYSVSGSSAYCMEDVGSECFTFSALGNDCQLFTKPGTALPTPAGIEPICAPVPLTRQALENGTEGENAQVLLQHYGATGSFAIWKGKNCEHLISAHRIVMADLTDWKYRPRLGQVAVDPVLGRFVFNSDETPEDGAFVSYHYGACSDMGGGEYERPMSGHAGRKVYTVGSDGHFSRIHDALAIWQKEKPLRAVIEIVDSHVYADPIKISLLAGQELEIRAGKRVRPIIRLLDWEANRADALQIMGGPGSRLVLDGLLVVGRGVRVKGNVAEFRLQHCTLVPGWDIQSQSEPKSPGECSLELTKTSARVTIVHSILGPIEVIAAGENQAPNEISISESIVDSTTEGGVAISGPDGSVAAAYLTVERSTVIGGIRAKVLALAENSIFTGQIAFERTDEGCVRFCYLPLRSTTPRRYHCQPTQDNEGTVAPYFSSMRYGTANYCQLAQYCPAEIMRGAEHESEMGVYNHLYTPHRAANLVARLDEYVPAEFGVSVTYVT